MKPTCGMIVLCADGTREYLRYDSYGLMKYEARSMEGKREGMVVYWWSELGEPQEYLTRERLSLYNERGE